MKRIVLLLSLYSSTSFAQSGFFLQPEIGYGISNVNSGIPPAEQCMEDKGEAPKNIQTLNPQLLVGYRFHKWEVLSGVSYLKSGYTEKYLNDGVIHSTQTEHYSHIVVPLTVTRIVPLGNGLSFYPGIGVEYSHNSSLLVKDGVFPISMSNSQFHQEYKASSLWGVASANFGYAINQRLSLIAGPEVQYMMTSILNDKVFKTYQRNYTVTFNAGVKWNLKRSHL